MNIPSQDYAPLEKILREAGAALNQYSQAANFRIHTKVDDSLVTDADLASEKSILDNLARLFPGDLVLSEEAGWSAMQRVEGQYVWVIDPLDGTTNFANSYPFYCISIARARFVDGKMDVELGGVYDPVRDRLYMAAKGKGAYCNGQAINVRLNKDLQNAFLVTGFSYHKGEVLAREVKRFLKVAEVSSSIRRDGAAALDLALVAEGIYDGYWETGLKPWDVAAGALLVEEAGGVVRNLGSVSRFDPEVDTIVSGSPKIVEFLEVQLA
ncbi:MAG: inositol monophosphatase family protein [Oligoflexus sp.]